MTLAERLASKRKIKAFALVEEVPVSGIIEIDDVESSRGRHFVDARVLNEKLKVALLRTKKIYLDLEGRLYEAEVTFFSGDFVSFTGVVPSPLERRQNLRVLVPLMERECEVTLFFPEKRVVRGYLVDISTTGAGFQVSSSVSGIFPGTEVLISWEPERLKANFKLPVKVLNVEEVDAGIRAGGVFSGISSETVDLISRYVALRQKEIARILL